MVDLDSPKTFIVFTLIAAAVLFIATFLAVSQRTTGSVETSENLTGGHLLLNEGDRLIYMASLNDTEFNFSVEMIGIDRLNNCSLLKQTSAFYTNITGCYSVSNSSLIYVVLENNTISGGIFAGGLPAIHAFEPWMVAAEKGWSGSTKVSRFTKPDLMPMLAFEETIETHYSCNETEIIFGRRALKVGIETFRQEGIGENKRISLVGRRTVWIDLEKRIMLKEEASTGNEIATYSLLSAPFPLNTSG